MDAVSGLPPQALFGRETERHGSPFAKRPDRKLPPELGIPLGTLAAAGLGVVFGAVAIRRQGTHFAMIPLALSQMIFFIALRVPFTHGEDGIQAVPRAMSLGYRTDRSKLLAFVLSATLSRLAGGTEAIVFRCGIAVEILARVSKGRS